MTFADAIESLGTTRNAAKRASWSGYVFRTEGQTEGAYTLTYKNKNNVDYVYSWDGSAWTAPATTVPFDAEFHAAMLASDWIVGKQADFEAARGGSGTW